MSSAVSLWQKAFSNEEGFIRVSEIFLCCFLFLLARATRLEQQTSPATRQTETVKMIRQTETSVRLRAGRPALSEGVREVSEVSHCQ